MDIHHRAVAVIHIICGTLALLLLAALALFFGALVSVQSLQVPVLRMLFGFGSLFFVPMMALAVAQIVAAICLLNGSRGARAWILVFGVLGLINFPIGTVIGAYTMWALLRKNASDVTVIVSPN